MQRQNAESKGKIFEISLPKHWHVEVNFQNPLFLPARSIDKLQNENSK
jgi:hypothetical protein